MERSNVGGASVVKERSVIARSSNRWSVLGVRSGSFLKKQCPSLKAEVARADPQLC